MTREAKQLLGLALLAIAVRLVALAFHPAIHPDAFFQYLEPAWWHAHGYGHPTWEWRTGLRSWVVPTYYGAWMELFSFFGLGTGRKIQTFFAVHWCVLNGLLVYLAYRTAYACTHAARLAFEDAPLDPSAHHAGLVAALLTAICPTLAYFGGQTLVETPSVLVFLGGAALYAESIGAIDRRLALRRAIAAGALLALGACIRLSYAPIAVIFGLEAIVSRRGRVLSGLVLGAIPVVVAFGAVDRLTWGTWFHSVIEYVRYNFIEGRAAEHGVEPLPFYAETIAQRAGVAIAISLPIVLLRARRALPVLLLAIGVVAYLTTQPHKEERFMLIFWPLWAIATGLGFAAARGATGAPRRARMLDAALAVLVVGLVAQGTRSHAQGPEYDYTFLHGMYEGQAFVGAQPDSTGVLLGGSHHLNGGAMATGKDIPFASVGYAHLPLALFNYAVVAEQGRDHDVLVHARFTPVARFGTHVVMRR